MKGEVDPRHEADCLRQILSRRRKKTLAGKLEQGLEKEQITSLKHDGVG